MNMKELSELKKRPQYFSFFLECCNMISLLDETSAGRVIHAIADYFSYGEEPTGLTRNEQRVFDRIRQDIDKNCESWLKSVEGGRKRARDMWGGDDGTLGDL